MTGSPSAEYKKERNPHTLASFKEASVAEPLKILPFPTFGWRQILTAREKMLDEYDRARAQSRAHEVETYHGVAGEASVREWLADFLPKRYAVTAGYVISPGLDSDDKAPHYDVVIYDQLESPILWVEEHSGVTKHGRALAIPVEHVCCVLEVKATMSVKNVRKAITHLRDLAPMMGGIDAPRSPYKMYLRDTFCCGAVFFELRKAEETSDAALAALVDGLDLRGFFGGMILRAESHTTGNTGLVNFLLSEEPIAKPIPDKTLLSEFGISKSVQIGEGQHIGSQIEWMESAFSRFAFDLIARMQGSYRPGRISSFYGLGSEVAELMKLTQRHSHGVPRKDIT
jgi:hypothetical protein